MLTPNNKKKDSQCTKKKINKILLFLSIFVFIIITLIYIIAIIEVVGFKRRDVITDNISFDDMSIAFGVSAFGIIINMIYYSFFYIKTYDCE